MTEATPVLPGLDESSDDTTPERPRRRRRILKALAILATVSLVGIAVLAGIAAYYANKFDDNVDRIDGVFTEIPDSTRPAKPAKPGSTGENFLLVGSDIRAPKATTGDTSGGVGGGLSDIIMIIHVAADKKTAHVISIPRDSWVDIPGRKKKYKINGAYALGGPSLVVQTVEALTRIRIDHYLAIDMRGFAAMTDAVGGVVINVPADAYDRLNQKQWYAGPQLMDGEKALLFVRHRAGLPRADLDRITHQHLFLRALMTKVTGGGQLRNPVKLTRLLNAITKSISVDSGLSAGELRSLAFSLRDLRGSAVRFLTVPTAGFHYVGEAGVVFLDPARGEILYRAVRSDTLASYKSAPAR